MRLEVENLTYSYGEKEAADQVSLKVDRGEFVGIIGPNGSGKRNCNRTGRTSQASGS